MDNSLSKKLRYHKGMKQTSTDKSSSQILTSSPLLDRKRDLYKNLHDNEKFALDECRNTIQSGAEEGNFLIESQDAEVFRTALKNSRGKSDILGDDEHTTKYAKSTERLLETIGESLEYFHKLGDWNLKSEKVSTVKILKEDYEKFQMEYNKIVSENIKLKEKIKSLKESGIPKGGVTNNGLVFSENFNVNKMLDSLLFLQTKNQELEKENKILLVEMEEMKKKLDTSKKKGQGERRNLTKKSPVHSTNNYTSNNKTKNDHMEYLLKEQISCMQKMLMLIQDDKEVNTMPSKKKFSIPNDYEGESDDSNFHFEEAFNVTNVSNSEEYQGENLNSFEKDNYEVKPQASQPKKIEIMLKLFEKNKKRNNDMKLENAIDDDIQRIPSSQNHSVRQKEKEYTIKNNKNKNSSTVLFNLSKTSRKGGEVSHRIQNLK